MARPDIEVAGPDSFDEKVGPDSFDEKVGLGSLDEKVGLGSLEAALLGTCLAPRHRSDGGDGDVTLCRLFGALIHLKE